MIVIAIKTVCTRCSSELGQVHFYKSNSEVFKYTGRIPICKECLNDLYEIYLKEFKSDIKAMYKLCLKLDVYYDNKLFETSKDKHEDSNMTLPIYYMSKVGLSQYKGKTFSDSDMIDIWSKDKVEIKIEDKKEEKNKVTKEMIQRWGSTFEPEDYIFLEDRYNHMKNAYGDKNISSLWDYQIIAVNYLKIKRLSEQDDEKSISNATKLMSENAKLMKDCEMKSVQQKSGETDFYSNFIERIEYTRPVCEPSPFFKDVDRCDEYFSRFVKQPLQVSLDLEKLESIENWEEEFDTFGDDEDEC